MRCGGRKGRKAMCYSWAATLLVAGPVAAQELEPRALTNAPVGMNFALLAAGYSRGNVLLDAALPVEDSRADVWSATVGLVRAVDVFGLSGRIGAVAPLVTGNFKGTVASVDTSTTRVGLADPRIVLAVNFIGAPALTMSEMRGYRQSTVVGFQVKITLPLGQYSPDRLINLGSNRWAFRPQLGVSQALGRRWIVEGYAAATFYTHNTDFLEGSTFTQEPFFETTADVIYAIRVPDIWVALSLGYGWGAEATVDSVTVDPLQNLRASAVLKLPISRQHGLKFVYVSGITTKLGADFDTIQLAYQYTFGGRR